MAQMKYEDFVKFNQRQNQGNDGDSQSRARVRYFALKNDGDSGVVRFNLSSLDDIKIVSKHTVKSKEGKLRIISCLRTDPNQPLSVCPLCAAGEKVAYRAYIPLVFYEQAENGDTVPVAAFWEQAPRIRETLQSFLNEFGDLRDSLFKIIRHGQKGDPSTTYTLMPANSKVYPDSIFKKDFSGFDSLDFERVVATKTAEEMNTFLAEGDFPFKQTTSAATKQVTEMPDAVTKPVSAVNTYRAPTPVEESTQVEETPAPRPRRTYTY